MCVANCSGLFVSEDYLRSKLLRSASEEGLNIPSTPEFSFDGNLEGATGTYRRQSSRLVSPTSPVSESESSYHGSARSVLPVSESESSYPSTSQSHPTMAQPGQYYPSASQSNLTMAQPG